MIRRMINLALIAFAFYGGLKFEAMLNDGRCSAAGGKLVRGVCVGAAP